MEEQIPGPGEVPCVNIDRLSSLYRPISTTHLATVGARQWKREHEYLFSACTGSPVDMNMYRRRKMTALLKPLAILRAGFHAIRHFTLQCFAARCFARSAEDHSGEGKGAGSGIQGASGLKDGELGFANTPALFFF
jgi:hypothetical protein